MEHLLIQGGETYLPFARSRIKALKALGLDYADQSFEVDSVSIRVSITPGHEYVFLSGGGVGMRICINSSRTDPDFRQIGTGIDFGKKSLVEKNLYKVSFEAKDVLLTAQYLSPNGKIFFELKDYESTQSGVTYKAIIKGPDGVGVPTTIGFAPTRKESGYSRDLDHIPFVGSTCSKSPCVTNSEIRFGGDQRTGLSTTYERGPFDSKFDVSVSQAVKDDNGEWSVDTKIVCTQEYIDKGESASYIPSVHYFRSGFRDLLQKTPSRIAVVATKKDTYALYMEFVSELKALSHEYAYQMFTAKEMADNTYDQDSFRPGLIGFGETRSYVKSGYDNRLVLAKQSTNYEKIYITPKEYHEAVDRFGYGAQVTSITPDINTDDVPKIEYILAPDVDNDLCRCFVLTSRTTDTSNNPIYRGYRELKLYEIDSDGVVTETLLYKTTTSSLLFSSSHEVAYAIDPSFTQNSIDRTFREYFPAYQNNGEKGVGFTKGNISVCATLVPEGLTVFECSKATDGKPAKYKLKHGAADVWEAFFIFGSELHVENYGRTQMIRYSLKENDEANPENMKLLGSYPLDGAAIVPSIK